MRASLPASLVLLIAPAAAAQTLPPRNSAFAVERVTPDPMEFARGGTATFQVRVSEANSQCSATVQYSTGPTTFGGALSLASLRNQRPDSVDVVTFRWQVAPTAGARGKIDVTCLYKATGYLEPHPVYFTVVP